jgi:hypothetical protein
MTKTVDSYRFIRGFTKRIVKNWIKMETPRPIPWTPLSKPLPDACVALISSGGIALKTDEPFDQEGERRNPWWGDPSHRIIPRTATGDDLRLYHLHVAPEPFEEDANCLLPLDRLWEMEAEGEIGRLAPSHYSFMGYILEPEELLEGTVPAIVRQLQAEEVDLVLLVPA